MDFLRKISGSKVLEQVNEKFARLFGSVTEQMQSALRRTLQFFETRKTAFEGKIGGLDATIAALQEELS